LVEVDMNTLNTSKNSAVPLKPGLLSPLMFLWLNNRAILGIHLLKGDKK
jgi:hypothetical protein